MAKPLKATAGSGSGSRTGSSRNRSTGPRTDRTLTPVTGHDAGALAPELDRLVHERLRLGIVSALAVNETLSFNELKQLMRTTDGNLSVHARKLEEAKYIACAKTFEGRVPHTRYALTALGRSALERYLNHMEALIRATRER